MTTRRSDPPPSRMTKADLEAELVLLNRVRQDQAVQLAAVQRALDLAGVPDSGTVAQRVGQALHELDQHRNRYAAQPEPWGVWLARMAWGLWR